MMIPSPIRSALLGTLCLAGLSGAAFGATRAAVPLEGFAQQDWAGEYLAEKAGDALYEGIRARGLSLLAMATAHGQDSTHCVARVGLTYAPADARKHPRDPGNFYFGASSGRRPNTENDPASCRGVALKRAIDQLVAEKDVAGLLAGTDVTREDGSYAPRKADKTEVWLTSNLNQAARQHVFAQVPDRFGQVFDYRQFQLWVNFKVVPADGSDKVCAAWAGFTARAPEDRNPHVPAVRSVFARHVPQAGERTPPDTECFDPMVNAALEEVLGKSWDEALIANFDLVAEKGRAVPRATAIRQAVSAAEQAEKRQARAEVREPAVRSVQQNTCTNQCVNGDCVRTFPNGRKERYQAQRKFNPFTSQWEWDTSGC